MHGIRHLDAAVVHDELVGSQPSEVDQRLSWTFLTVCRKVTHCWWGRARVVRRVRSGRSLLSWIPTQPPVAPTSTQLPVPLERLDYEELFRGVEHENRR